MSDELHRLWHENANLRDQLRARDRRIDDLLTIVQGWRIRAEAYEADLQERQRAAACGQWQKLRRVLGLIRKTNRLES